MSTVAVPSSYRMRLVEGPRVLTAAATTVSFTGLNGNVQGKYHFKWRVLAAAGNSTITIKPNGVATNQRCNDLEISGATVTGSSGTTLRIGDVTNGFTAGGWGELNATCVTSTYRTYTAHSVRAQNAAAPIHKIYSGVWEDTTTNITSFDFLASTASGFDIGSTFELYYYG